MKTAEKILPVLEPDDRQFYEKGFEIIFHLDIAFRDEFVAIVEVAQADLRCGWGIIAAIHHIPHDDVVGRDGDIDEQGFLFAEFVMFYGIFHEGLEGNGGDEEVLGGEVRDLDGHGDRVGEPDLQQVEVVADELHFFAEEDEVPLLIAEDIAVDPGEGVVIEPGAFGVAGDEEGQGIEGIKDKVGVDLVLEGFQFGLGLGDIELFHPGFVVFLLEVEEEDLVDIGDEAGGDDDDKDGVDQLLVLSRRFVRAELPEAEEEHGDCAGVDDIGEEEGDDDLVIRFL